MPSNRNNQYPLRRVFFWLTIKLFIAIIWFYNLIKLIMAHQTLTGAYMSFWGNPDQFYSEKLKQEALDRRVGYPQAMLVENYIKDGFIKICDVDPSSTPERWIFKNINKEVFYSKHTSWIYMITEDGYIVKLGETGQPLGIPKTNSDQPRYGTMSRMGRLANHPNDKTDARIRASLEQSVKLGLVSIWARQCDIYEVKQTVAGETSKVMLAAHKDLELKYLDHMGKLACYPVLNAGRK